jgi:hypothetical protein
LGVLSKINETPLPEFHFFEIRSIPQKSAMVASEILCCCENGQSLHELRLNRADTNALNQGSLKRTISFPLANVILELCEE